jgi:dephospho-CoA kinase
MLKVGLTGGIGCGKTTVANLFAGWGVPIIDADVIAHDLVQPHQPALAKIQENWGDRMLNADGSLCRPCLRELVFSHPEEKQKLEAIMHPLIFQTMQTAIKQIDAQYCLLAIPLLFETQMTQLVDRILVVDCPVESQIRRVEKRDHLPLGQIQAIIASQVSREYRISHADDLIENTENNGKLAEQVKKLHNLYLSISNFQD